MGTITKKALVDKISQDTNQAQVIVKRVIQQFLDEIIDELSNGNRLEFRDFGVFEVKERASRIGRNPRTGEEVKVPKRNVVTFKVGRLMKKKVQEKKR
ncbi:MAG: HU family DNA-binding protein [Planctomycetota bacterium]